MHELGRAAVGAEEADHPYSGLDIEAMYANQTGGDMLLAAVDDREITLERPRLETKVIGRMEFGSGNIDGNDCSPEKFDQTLRFIADHGLTTLSAINRELVAQGKEPVHNIFELPSNCMDGRGNKVTLAGERIAIARPKVVGGAPLYLTNVLSVAGQMRGTMIGRFSQATSMFPRAAAMHMVCGMAGKGSTPVLEKYFSSFDEINEQTADLTGGKMHATPAQTEQIKRGLGETIETASGQLDAYNEEQMIEVVRSVNGDNAVLEYHIDHNHPTHSHTEKGLAVLFSSDDLVMIKDAVASRPDIADVFYHNAGYAEKLIKASLGTLDQERLQLAQIVGMHLPQAAAATLGKGQLLGSIGDYAEMEQHLYAA